MASTPAIAPAARASDAAAALRADATPLAIARRHPALAALPRVELTRLPTAIERIALPALRGVECFVKRDDRSSPLYGGNKARKLELVLAAARARGARRLVTTGGIGTHHGLATALFGRTLGMRTTVVVVPQPPTPHVHEQVQALCAAGAELRPALGVPGAAVQVIRAFAAATLRGERPYWVATGGSSAFSDVAFVSAAFELAEQVAAGAMPEPAEIWVPLGSGGTLAGLVLGARLAGLRARVIGVLVTDILPPSEARLARLANASLALLRRLDPTIPDARLRAADFAIERGQLGPGYGATTPAAETACAVAQGLGLALETTYTAKTFAAVLERARRSACAGPILFWNTFSAVAPPLEPPAGCAATPVPARIARWLAAGAP